MFPYQYQSRGFPARRQPQQPYSELDAYAEDLEYRASLARQAARRPAPRHYPREEVYAPAPVYERAPRYQRPVYREPVYAPREPEYRGYPTEYYEEYAPEPVYADASYEYDDAYAYEYPEPARPAPRPVSYYAPPPAPAPRRIAAPEYIEAPVVEVAPRARQVAPRPRALPAPAPRPQTPSPQEAKLDQIIDLLKDTLKQKQRSAPAPAAAPAPRPRAPSRPQSQHGLPAELESVLGQLFAGGRPERAAPQARPRAPEPQAPEAADIAGLQNLLGQLFGGAVPSQQVPQPARRAPAQQQQVESSPLDALLGQIMGAMGQAPQSADPELPIVPGPASAAGRLPTRLPAQPTMKPFPKAQAPAPAAAPANPSKPAYTFALPASAQLNAIPRRASPPAAASVASNRSSAHIPANPNDAGRFNVRAGAADEVADIREAIRRSLDRSEDVKAEAPKAAAAPTPAPAPAAAEPEVPSTAMGAIGAIESRFVNLTYDFKFPTNPDFSPTASSASSALLFTPTNAPVRAYEQSLTSLLTDLDAVDSQGDEDVRHARKELVKRVEAALESLDAVKAAAWAHFKGEEVPAPAPVAAPAEVEAEEEEGYVIPESPVEAEAEPAQAESAPVEEAPAAAAEAVVADEVETQTQPDDIHPASESEVASVSHTSEVEEPTTAAAAPVDAHHDIDADSLGSSPVAVPSDLSDE